jgi:hypothetical protein
MIEKPEKYYVDETVIAVVVSKYPDISYEIKFLLEAYRPRFNQFFAPKTRVENDWMSHQEAYDYLIWTRGWRSDADTVKCNTQLLNFLKESLGWNEENEKNYPNPRWII